MPLDPAGTATPHLAVPAYFHPAVAGADWAELTAAAAGISAVVLNIDSGPGVRPEPELLAASVLAAAAGIPVLGYVDSGYGSRSLREVTVDMGRYRSWYPVSGYFLDQASSSGRYLGYYGDVVAAGRALGGERIVLNPGTYPDPRYAGVADALVTFEGDWADYQDAYVPPWARELPAEAFWHLVYGSPQDSLAAVLNRATATNAGTVYVTDRRGANPWDGLPTYFAELLATAAPRNPAVSA
jgi:hypothetical protein